MAPKLPAGEHNFARVNDRELEVIDGPHQGHRVHAPRKGSMPPKKKYAPPTLEPLYTKAAVIELLESAARGAIDEGKRAAAVMRRRNVQAHLVNNEIARQHLVAATLQAFASDLRTGAVALPRTLHATKGTPK